MKICVKQCPQCGTEFTVTGQNAEVSGRPHPLYALPPDLAEYLLRHLQQERVALDGFLRLGNEKPRAKRLDAWIACLTHWSAARPLDLTITSSGPMGGSDAPTVMQQHKGACK